MEYKHANGCSSTLDGFDLPAEKRRSLNLFGSPRSSATEHKSCSEPPSPYCPTDYVDIHESGHFTSPQLIAILFSVIYPMYLSSTEYRRFLEGLPLIEFEESASAGPGSFKEPNIYSQQARRAQEMLLSCAATFDESLLVDTLADPAWTEELAGCFDKCSFGITVSDSNKDGAPIIYSNHAFTALSGYTRTQALGKSIDFLNGPATESSMSSVVKRALNQSSSVKVALHHKTSSGKKFLNLLSVRPCGGYTIVVHYPPTKAFKMEDLKVKQLLHSSIILPFSSFYQRSASFSFSFLSLLPKI